MSKHGLIPQEWLLSYAAGALTEAQSVLVATHAAYHPELQDQCAVAEAVGGAMLGDCAPSPMSAQALDDIWGKIAAFEDEVPEADDTYQKHEFDPDIPAVLRDYIGKPLDQLKWRLMGPGMRQARLLNEKTGERLWLLKAKGGTVMPVHDHRGTEFTLVLRGSYHVGDQHFTPGQMELAGPETLGHQPIIDEGEDCICLAVTDAPIRPYSLIGRMVQPFIGL